MNSTVNPVKMGVHPRPRTHRWEPTPPRHDQSRALRLIERTGELERRRAAPPGEPISPELALIDPDLAAELRATLHAPGAFRPGLRVSERPHEQDERTEGEARSPLSQVGLERQAAVPMTSLMVGEVRRMGESTPIPSSTRRRRRPLVTFAAALALALASALLGAAAMALKDSADNGSRPSATAPPSRTIREASPRATRKPQPAATRAPTPNLSSPIVRTLAWAPTPGASTYEIQLFRGSRRVFLSRRSTTRLVLGPTWRYAGHTFQLRSGIYRWYVWPVNAAGTRQAQPVVEARVEIAPA